MIPAHPSGSFRFGSFELQPTERRLLAHGSPVRLGRHAFDLLTVLVENRGHLMTKDALLERVWPKVIVEENTLHAHMSALRKVLGPDAIATVSGQGYRFVLDVAKLDSAPAPAADAIASNLPHQLTSFIGREREIAEVQRLLETTRLLTLTGAGGCGKTRLALQVAGQRSETYPDGLWFIEFAALSDPNLVPQIVGRVLGVKERHGTDLTDTITEHFASKHALLILDNAEHVVDACARLSDRLLRRCARLVVLVTSREPLGIIGESTFRVPSLSVPDPVKDATPGRLPTFESARLFVERARLQRQHFTITDENAPALASICHQLDGIPLAIELAAPRLRSMSIEELSRGLEHRFGLLTGGSRTALPRHRTLRSLIDWSHDLLSDDETAMLRRASVFAGGWTADAACEVCGVPGRDEGEVFDLLATLADKSLIVADEHDGATRYGMLETVRHYARERLRESGEEAETRSRHLRFWLAFAVKAEVGLTGPGQQEWLDRLDREHGNLRAALSWSLSSADHRGEGLALAGAISGFWYARGHFIEGRRWLSLLLDAGSDRHPEARAKALRGASVLAVGQGDDAVARKLCDESLAISRRLADRAGIAASLNVLGVVARDEGDYVAARKLLEEALSIQRESGTSWGVANALINLGIVAASQGDLSASEAFWTEALAMFRDAGNRVGMAAVLNNLGHGAQLRGDHARARAFLEESLSIARALGNPPQIADSLNSLGLVVSAQEDHDTAFALQAEALALGRELGNRQRIASAMDAFAAIAHALDQPARAARIWGYVERLREEIDMPRSLVDASAYERRVGTARAAGVDAAAFESAWQEGRAMTLEQAARFVLDRD